MLWTADLAAAQPCAARADFSGCLARCQTLATAHANDPEALLSIGALLLSAGLLSAAETCFAHASTLAPGDARPWVNRANRAREAGEHARARHIMQALLEQFPNHPVIRRNALTSLEYDPEASPPSASICLARAFMPTCSKNTPSWISRSIPSPSPAA
ncbi:MULTISPECIES: hypothetical protein [Thiorhodovibrio]|uniref:hypothetical protein n=1 Tax=Thiorhodovibrio TaxID=61593 RepID=UPI0019131A21|nr:MULTISPECIES: hypothetical protein [Thiorhodovibrio]MBK5967468.1 hypothetical protein [Thiorhodovibrio winogradskyi]WPL15006.1 putative PEP-CTERM system TPR-repeat lipoprotein [Thiorhodovibrio litoralis]